MNYNHGSEVSIWKPIITIHPPRQAVKPEQRKTNQLSITAPDPARSLIQTQLPDSDRPAPSPLSARKYRRLHKLRTRAGRSLKLIRQRAVGLGLLPFCLSLRHCPCPFLQRRLHPGAIRYLLKRTLGSVRSGLHEFHPLSPHCARKLPLNGLSADQTRAESRLSTTASSSRPAIIIFCLSWEGRTTTRLSL